MNSYIKLKNGVIINLSQIEAIGPLVPFNMTLQGVFTGDDEAEYYNGVYDLGMKISESNNKDIKDLTCKIFLVPTNSSANDVYDLHIPEEYGYAPQPYMVLLKSGRILLLTPEEYQNIIDIMAFEENNYSNIDMKYTKFE